MKKFILPVVLVMTGAGAAFATNQAKVSEVKNTAQPGYLYNSTLGVCEMKAECTTEEGDVCTVNNIDGQPQVFGISGGLSTCNIELHQPRVN